MVCREPPSSTRSDAGDELATKRAKVTSEWVRPDRLIMNNFSSSASATNRAQRWLVTTGRAAALARQSNRNMLMRESWVSAMDEGMAVLEKAVAAPLTEEDLGKYETLPKTQSPNLEAATISDDCGHWMAPDQKRLQQLEAAIEAGGWTRDPRWRRSSEGKTGKTAMPQPTRHVTESFLE